MNTARNTVAAIVTLAAALVGGTAQAGVGFDLTHSASATYWSNAVYVAPSMRAACAEAEDWAATAAEARADRDCGGPYTAHIVSEQSTIVDQRVTRGGEPKCRVTVDVRYVCGS